MVGLVDRTCVTSGRLARSKVMSDGTVGTVAALESAWRDVFVQLRPMIDLVGGLLELTDLGAHPVEVDEVAAALGRSVDQTERHSLSAHRGRGLRSRAPRGPDLYYFHSPYSVSFAPNMIFLATPELMAAYIS
jgi:hypothetical protein